MKAVICAAVLALAGAGASGEETKLGAGVSLKEATPIKALVETPADFVGKTIRVDGVATAVCEAMGCWMAVAPDGDPKGPTVRLKVEDGVIKFPVTAKGKKVSAEGVFEEIGAGDEHGKEAAGEHGKHDSHASKKYQIKATGAVVTTSVHSRSHLSSTLLH
ncbi:MAG TPA: hypothetical protein VJ813_09330 [Vicinamibacterales bacterium]|nr:hypothetical protein [Vicinamibacterales bacterium]